MEGCFVIVLVQEGGIGIVYKNFLFKVQVVEVVKVKCFEFGILCDLIIVLLLMMVCDVIEIICQYKIFGLLVIDKVGKVVGIVINCDLCFEINFDQLVKLIMILCKCLVMVNEEVSVEDVKELICEYCLECVLVIDD